ncbi:MAG: 50S ribosomal protein L23 [Patescibacteria group bacterium]|nr:50S ribosomal protein L23 [Patescibacteria group bacterium]
MYIKPVITEKSLSSAKEGKYTFVVKCSLTKHQIRLLIQDAFNVHVTKIATANRKREVKRTYRGQRQMTPATKKVIVSLKEGESIDLFKSKN